MNDPNKELRERSGSVDSNDPLVALLYDLLCDHMHPGDLERLVRQLEDDRRFHVTTVQYSNGWLASYARDLADRIRACERAPGQPGLPASR